MTATDFAQATQAELERLHQHAHFVILRSMRHYATPGGPYARALDAAIATISVATCGTCHQVIAAAPLTGTSCACVRDADVTATEMQQAHIDALITMGEQTVPGGKYARALEAAAVAIGFTDDVREFRMPAPADRADGEPGSH